MKFRNALLQRTAGERDAEGILLEARRGLRLGGGSGGEAGAAGVLAALVAVEAVVDLAARLARRHARVGELEAVAAALVLFRALERLGPVGARPAQRDQVIEIDRIR